jgi:hypothetical protein
MARFSAGRSGLGALYAEELEDFAAPFLRHIATYV